MFTRQHYKAIAEILERHNGIAIHGADYCDLVEDIADYFATDNPRFDKSRFILACGLDLPIE